mmetsp:Transcript_46603/g.123084  ORF Transcript_46603/g.123084 Transcript_46603/m.123084 type:complete len:189 (+) Transcript_46603:230-796(+)
MVSKAVRSCIVIACFCATLRVFLVTFGTASKDVHPSGVLDAYEMAQPSLSPLRVYPRYGLGNVILTLVSGLGLAVAEGKEFVAVVPQQTAELLGLRRHMWQLPHDIKEGTVLNLVGARPQAAAAAERIACCERWMNSSVSAVESDQYFLPLVTHCGHRRKKLDDLHDGCCDRDSQRLQLLVSWSPRVV